MHGKGTIDVESPSDFPDAGQIEQVFEPVINATIITPAQYVGNMIKLCEEKRGIQKDMTFLNETRVILKYHLIQGIQKY